MAKLWAEQALLCTGWAKNVTLEIGADGRIAAITPDSPKTGQICDSLLPAIANLHSHTFQRAMAGLSEFRSGSGDSFWTWRKLMYRFLDLLTPEDIEAIAAFAMVEMLEGGFGSLAEFHYIHHAPGGAAYEDIGELSRRIMAAAETTGMGLTLLPVLYQTGGCDGRALEGGQLRFGNDPEGFARILASVQAARGAMPADFRLGVAPHSLRAVARSSLDLLEDFAADGPIHMHIAEQEAEVADVLAHHGARPVEFLLNSHDVGEKWCLIHATRMTSAETLGLAQSGAVAGLCPMTESSLGDGIFDGVNYLADGGRFGVGTDSNIRISALEELRTLEYSQRLRDTSRAALATESESTGRRIYAAAAKGGAQALQRGGGALEVGGLADLVEISRHHPDLQGVSGDRLLDTMIFARDSGVIANLWSAGRHVVQDGRHIARVGVETRYRKVVKRLRDAW